MAPPLTLLPIPPPCPLTIFNASKRSLSRHTSHGYHNMCISFVKEGARTKEEEGRNFLVRRNCDETLTWWISAMDTSRLYTSLDGCLSVFHSTQETFDIFCFFIHSQLSISPLTNTLSK